MQHNKVPVDNRAFVTRCRRRMFKDGITLIKPKQCQDFMAIKNNQIIATYTPKKLAEWAYENGVMKKYEAVHA